MVSKRWMPAALLLLGLATPTAAQIERMQLRVEGMT